MSVERERTGRQRLRTKVPLFGPEMLVLQCEWHLKGFDLGSYGMIIDVDEYVWRDARVTDISEGSIVVDAKRKPCDSDPTKPLNK